MKFQVTYIRTLTLENEIEADSLEDAIALAEETISGLSNADYSDAELETEVEPKFTLECTDCHDAEGWDEALPWCRTCTISAHKREWVAYKAQVEERGKTEKVRCHGCYQFKFNCTLLDQPDKGLLVLCATCREKGESRRAQ
jgi:hypothetical protein